MPFRLFRVRGRSMLPTLADGDYVLARRLTDRRRATLATGAIVCVDHQHYGPMIKRTGRVDAGHCELISDGQLGSDSSALGTVTLERVTHVAWASVSPTGFKRLRAH
ncbi:MAG: S24/S26 family peptidase [Pseudomonadota bacterium]